MFWIEQFLYLTQLDIFVLACAVAGVAVLLSFLKLNKKKKLLPKPLVLPAVLVYLFPIAVMMYAFFVEPNILIVKNYSFDSPQVELQKPLKLVVIGDMQARARFAPSYVGFVTNQVNRLNGDYIIWVGDLIEDTTRDLPLFAPFADMNAAYGKFAVLGNHDYRNNMTDPVNQQIAKDVETFLNQAGFITLRNQASLTEANGQKIMMVGTEDLWSGRVDFTQVNKDVATVSGSLNLLITHQPTTILKNDVPELYSLTLSGHCHGGQINLLFLNPLFGLPHLPPGCFSNPDHVSGLFREDNQDILVTPGVGSLKVRARLFSPPEISVVTLY